MCQIAIIICISYDVLMIYCVYIIVIHDCMYARNMENILCLDDAIIVCISNIVIYFFGMCVSVYGEDFCEPANYHHCIINKTNL